jgi:hypothetical protein
VAEKAQHEPHYPWFLTGVTAPFSFQLIVSSRLSSGKRIIYSTPNYGFGRMVVVQSSLNCSALKSENSLSPISDVYGSEYHSSIRLTLS